MAALPCPCGRAQPYERCCGRYLDGGETPANAEILMRSRYTAYTRLRADYLRATWHPDTCPAELNVHEPPTKWLGLEVKAHQQQDAEHATVEFTARYKIQGRAFRMHEISRFVRVAGKWLYLDGEVT